jgi:hypothetical protein
MDKITDIHFVPLSLSLRGAMRRVPQFLQYLSLDCPTVLNIQKAPNFV